MEPQTKQQSHVEDWFAVPFATEVWPIKLEMRPNIDEYASNSVTKRIASPFARIKRPTQLESRERRFQE